MQLINEFQQNCFSKSERCRSLDSSRCVVSFGNFTQNATKTYEIKKSGNGVYVFVISGSVK